MTATNKDQIITRIGQGKKTGEERVNKGRKVKTFTVSKTLVSTNILSQLTNFLQVTLDFSPNSKWSTMGSLNNQFPKRATPTLSLAVVTNLEFSRT